MRRYRVQCAIVAIALTQTAFSQGRIRWEDLPGPAAGIAEQLGVNKANFDQRLKAIEQRTTERLSEGEYDHLVYYMLQSTAFGYPTPIEPSHSAVEYMDSPMRSIPAAVEKRITALAKVFSSAPEDERQRYFASLAHGTDGAEAMRREYARAMRFLFEKEIACRTARNPQACIASLYANRGHSSDTSVDTTRSVSAALAWIATNYAPPIRIARVLIIGPGVDFAPRSGLNDAAAPRVYQPAAVAAALREAKIAASTVHVDCIDINPRVITYARTSCNSIWNMNAATERLEPSPAYDLIVATNVLLYMDEVELLLAFNNLASMLAPTGFFVHNDVRFESQVFGRTAGLPVQHFESVILDAQRKPVLLDRFVVHSARVRQR